MEEEDIAIIQKMKTSIKVVEIMMQMRKDLLNTIKKDNGLDLDVLRGKGTVVVREIFRICALGNEVTSSAV